MRPRLWVLDKGNVNCPAKVAIYNLFQKINYTLEAPEDIPKDRLNYLIVDGDVKTNGARAYVGLDGENYLLVFSLNEFKWWRVNLHSANNNLAISTKFLAFSRKEAILYVTGGEERPQNGIWALVNFNKPNECSEETPMVLKRRLVKILKYNVLT
ncbi:uncharacterized protein BDFB_004427, partial [Asbolus verrucosus]